MESQFIAISNRTITFQTPRATPGELGLRTAQPWRLKPELGIPKNMTIPLLLCSAALEPHFKYQTVFTWESPAHESWDVMSHGFPHGTILKHFKYLNKITQSMAVSSIFVRFIEAQLPAKNTRVPKDPLLASHNRPNVARTNHSTSDGEGWPDLLECFWTCWRYDLSINI